MAMRAASSPGCGAMHKTPTSALSRAPKTSAGAAAIGRGPNSSSKSRVARASRSSSAAAMLAATARLVSSAINATFSPERTPRHVSTALRAPGISSGSGAPKLMQISVLESQRFSNPVIVRWLLSNCREDGAKPADASNARGHVFGLTQNAGTCPHRVPFETPTPFARRGHGVSCQHAQLDRIDPLAVRSQRLPVPCERLWVGDERRYALLFEARLENLKFTPRWNFFPVHDGNLRFLRGAAPIPIALEQRFEQLGAQRVGLHFVFPGELAHHREFVENFSERFRVTWAGG